jgi:hypothetical protein
VVHFRGNTDLGEVTISVFYHVSTRPLSSASDPVSSFFMTAILSVTMAARSTPSYIATTPFKIYRLTLYSHLPASLHISLTLHFPHFPFILLGLYLLVELIIQSIKCSPSIKCDYELLTSCSGQWINKCHIIHIQNSFLKF